MLFIFRLIMLLFILVSVKVYAEDTSGIIFSPDTESRPSDGSFDIQAGSYLTYCLRLQGLKFPFIEKVKDKVIGYKIDLEDQQNPPHHLTIIAGDRHKREKPDNQGCYAGGITIMRTQAEGLYQVADLLLLLDDNSFYSLRPYLFRFKFVDQINIASKYQDISLPQLLDVGIYGDAQKKYQVATRETIIAKPVFYLKLKDDHVGVDRNQVSAFLKIYLAGQWIDTVKIKCHAYASKGMYYCKNSLKHVLEDWYYQTLEVELDSVVIEDKISNRNVIVINDYLDQKNLKPPLRIVFTAGHQVQSFAHKKLQKNLKKNIYSPHEQGDFKEGVVSTLSSE